MIYAKRTGTAPASLSSTAALKEASEADTYYRTWVADQPAFVEFTHYKGPDVQLALRKMFGWKCAYCERQLEKGSFEVEHYRPKGRVEGCDHPGYWWLALDWTNLLPTCAACNKAFLQHIVTADMTVEQVEALQATSAKELHGKAMQFPVSGTRLQAKSNDHFAEGPLLIDPTRTNPEPHLKWRFDCTYSVVEAANGDHGPSPLGSETIKCVALNRIDLVENRTQVLERLKAQQIQIMNDLRKAADDAPPEQVTAAIETALLRISDIKLSANSNQPFAGMVRAFLRQFYVEFRAEARNRGYDVSALED